MPGRKALAFALALVVTPAAAADIGVFSSYAGGRTRFSLSDGSAGDAGFARPFDVFKGQGSYAHGLTFGEDRTLPGGLVLGLEADLTAPGVLAATRALTPGALFTDTVLLEGALRGRLGRRIGDTLVYGTAGLAVSRDRLARVTPGASDDALIWRTGPVVGAGLSVPIAPRWSARAEYLHATSGAQTVTLQSGAVRAVSDQSLDTFRFGLNYQWEATPKPLETSWLAFHGQTTLTAQYALPFRAPYRGPDSLDRDSLRETLDITFYLGVRPWKGGELWINPEIDQGFGLSSTVGAAGFPSAEAYKVGAEYPYARFHRYFLRQTVDLGGPRSDVSADLNILPGKQTRDRLVITAGKFASSDVFDTNRYAHDPRNDYLNWTLVDTGSFDYAADAWAFTYGLALEWYNRALTYRLGYFDLPVVPNSTDLDPTFAQHQWDLEVERRHSWHGHPGKLMATAFLTHGRMARFSDALALGAATAAAPDVALVRSFHDRTGVALSAEQQLTENLGAFARLGWSDPTLEPFAFTDVDRAVAAGLQLSGKAFGRPKDEVGVALAVNEIGGLHQRYFAAGGVGVLVGDGQLPHPAAERDLEAYYQRPLGDAKLTLDGQLLQNPAYNRDRGPVPVVGVRLHAQF